MLARWRRCLPSQDDVKNNRWLRWMGPRLLHPRMWHFSRRGVARGVATGVFFGFLIPIAQIPLAAAMAVLLRANVAIAIASTLVTNPITFAPVYIFAHAVGESILAMLGLSPSLMLVPESSDAISLLDSSWNTLRGMGASLMVGLSVIAVSAGVASYTLVMLLWRFRILWVRKQRAAARCRN